MIQINGPRGWAIRASLWLALSALLFIVLIHLTGCGTQVAATVTAWSGERGSGIVISRSRATGPFNRVKVNGPIEVIITQGPVRKVVVVTDDNLLSLLETKTWNGLITIGFRSLTRVAPTKATVKLTMPQLREVAVNGSGRVSTFDRIEVQDLDLAVSGSGRLDLTAKVRSVILNVSGSGRAELGLETEHISAEINGSGKITLTGQAERLDAGINGSSRLYASRLSSQTCLVVIHGSGKALVKVEKTLQAAITGSGKISYWGQPKIESQVRGSGKIEPFK